MATITVATAVTIGTIRTISSIQQFMIELTSPLKMYSRPAYHIFAQSSPLGYNACHGLSTGVELYAAGGSAAGDCGVDERPCSGGEAPGAAGSDGVGQDLHHGQDHRGVEQAGADFGA